MSTITIKGELEIDPDRGVIYFHNGSTGQTVLRICRLPKPIPDPTQETEYSAVHGVMLDITHMFGVSWSHADAKDTV